MDISDDLKEVIQKYADEYCQFVNILCLPEFSAKVVPKDNKNDNYSILVSTSYNPNQDYHTLYISEEIADDLDIVEKFKRNIFHEFTHMIDAEKYAKCNKDAYIYLRGYTEFHASQVEFMHMLGAENINEKISFSMNQMVLPQMSCRDYLADKYELLVTEMSRESFYKDKDVMLNILGLLYNYLGIRSISKMYADYIDIDDFAFMADTFGSLLWSRIFHEMTGWFCDEQVRDSYISYSNAVLALFKQI